MTIQKELNVSDSLEYIRIKKENQILQAETARHIVERTELQELLTELEAEKRSKEALKSEIKHEILNALKKSELKRVQYSGDYIDEHIQALQSLDNENYQLLKKYLKEHFKA